MEHATTSAINNDIAVLSFNDFPEKHSEKFHSGYDKSIELKMTLSNGSLGASTSHNRDDIIQKTVTEEKFSVNNEQNGIESPLINHDFLDYAKCTSSDVAKLQGIVFLEDAIYYRSIHHKANQWSLKLYRIYYSAPIRCAVIVATFLILMLAFIEDPSSLSWSSDPRRNETR